MICIWCFLGLSYTWIFNNDTLYVQEDSHRFVSQETGNLYLAKVEPSDVGNYICVVTNSKEDQSVQEPPTPLTLRSDGKLSGHPWLQRCSTILTGLPPVIDIAIHSHGGERLPVKRYAGTRLYSLCWMEMPFELSVQG